jgi:Ca-activated chloride channel family protein
MNQSADRLAVLWSQWLAHDGGIVLARPEAFWFLLLPLALALWRHRRGRRMAAYADAELRPWAFAGDGERSGRTPARLGAIAAWWLFWLFASLALADPRVPQEEGVTETKAPVLFIVDGSAAMTGRDVSPSRAQRADLLIELVAERSPGHAFGLMRSVDTAGLLLPPSEDRGLLDFYSTQLRGMTAGDPPQVVQPAAAFRRAASMAALDGGAVVWLTAADERQFAGEAGVRLLEAAESLSERGIPIVAVALARETTPLYREDQPLRDAHNRVVTSTPSFRRVAEVAEFTGGEMRRTAVLSEDAAFLAERIAALPDPPVEDGLEGYRSLAVLALWAAFVWLSIHLWLEWAPPGRWLRTAVVVTGLVALPVVFTVAGAAPVVDADSQRAYLHEGQAYLDEEDFVRAQTVFDHAAGYAARLGGGLAAYRRGDFPHAVDRLQSAVWLAETDRQRLLALYDLGNALVLAGRYLAAVSAYDAALRLAPDHQPARQNRHLAAVLANAARQGVNEEQRSGFRGFEAQRPDPVDETLGARMSEEFLEAQGGGRGGRIADQPAASAEPFVLDEALLQGALKKLERIEDRPQPLLRSLLRQQPYKAVVNDRLEGGEDGR